MEGTIKTLSVQSQVDAFKFYINTTTVSDATDFHIVFTINIGFLGFEWIHFIIVCLQVFLNNYTLMIILTLNTYQFLT